jgi:hypothetical protein
VFVVVEGVVVHKAAYRRRNIVERVIGWRQPLELGTLTGRAPSLGSSLAIRRPGPVYGHHRGVSLTSD